MKQISEPQSCFSFSQMYQAKYLACIIVSRGLLLNYFGFMAWWVFLRINICFTIQTVCSHDLSFFELLLKVQKSLQVTLAMLNSIKLFFCLKILIEDELHYFSLLFPYECNSTNSQEMVWKIMLFGGEQDCDSVLCFHINMGYTTCWRQCPIVAKIISPTEFKITLMLYWHISSYFRERLHPGWKHSCSYLCCSNGWPSRRKACAE